MEIERRWKIAGFPENLPLLRQAHMRQGYIATAPVVRIRTAVILAAAMITAAAVSMCGLIGWVGLLVPHIARMIFGSNNQRVVPASIGFGAVFLLVIDTAARCVSAAEIPVSILTAIIGAPFFILLLRRTGGFRL